MTSHSRSDRRRFDRSLHRAFEYADVGEHQPEAVLTVRADAGVFQKGLPSLATPMIVLQQRMKAPQE